MNKTLRSSLNMINKDPKMILTKSTLVGGGLLATRIKNDLDKTKQNQGYVSDFYLNKNSKRENQPFFQETNQNETINLPASNSKLNRHSPLNEYGQNNLQLDPAKVATIQLVNNNKFFQSKIDFKAQIKSLRFDTTLHQNTSSLSDDSEHLNKNLLHTQ